MPNSKRPTTIDEYLATVTPAQRKALQTLRERVHAAARKAEECISYGMPAFRVDGKVVAGFQARASGCSYYPFSGTTLRTLAKDVEAYSQTKSALHFDAEAGLPAGLVRKLIKGRMAETK